MRLNRVCFNCGSSSFVSDRSLGGKIVCSKCGSSTFKNTTSSFIKSKKLVFVAIAIAIFIIVI
jgi:ribosomal protein S27AE